MSYKKRQCAYAAYVSGCSLFFFVDDTALASPSPSLSLFLSLFIIYILHLQTRYNKSAFAARFTRQHTSAYCQHTSASADACCTCRLGTTRAHLRHASASCEPVKMRGAPESVTQNVWTMCRRRGPTICEHNCLATVTEITRARVTAA